MRVFSKSGLQIAHDYERIVHNERGSYIEISNGNMILSSVEVPGDARWRLSGEYYSKVYYIEYRTVDFNNIKLYYQMNKVNYADYKIGFWYVDPDDVILK